MLWLLVANLLGLVAFVCLLRSVVRMEREWTSDYWRMCVREHVFNACRTGDDEGFHYCRVMGAMVHESRQGEALIYQGRIIGRLLEDYQCFV